MKKFMALLVCVSLTAMLSGCGSSVTLDRHIAVEGLHCYVPSGWSEERSDDTDDYGLGYKYGIASFHNEEKSEFIYVSYANTNIGKTPEEKMEEKKKIGTIDGLTKEFRYQFLESSAIDGAKCTVYEFGYELEGGNVNDISKKIAYIDAYNMSYEIEASPSMLDEVLKTVKLEEV